MINSATERLREALLAAAAALGRATASADLPDATRAAIEARLRSVERRIRSVVARIDAAATAGFDTSDPSDMLRLARGVAAAVDRFQLEASDRPAEGTDLLDRVEDVLSAIAALGPGGGQRWP